MVSGGAQRCSAGGPRAAHRDAKAEKAEKAQARLQRHRAEDEPAAAPAQRQADGEQRATSGVERACACGHSTRRGQLRTGGCGRGRGHVESERTRRARRGVPRPFGAEAVEGIPAHGMPGEDCTEGLRGDAKGRVRLDAQGRVRGEEASEVVRAAELACGRACIELACGRACMHIELALRASLSLHAETRERRAGQARGEAGRRRR